MIHETPEKMPDGCMVSVKESTSDVCRFTIHYM